MKKSICIIGIGKVGSAFSVELYDTGFDVKYIIGRDKKVLRKLSGKIKNSVIATVITEKIISQSDVIFITVKDGKLAETIELIAATGADINKKIFIHTSGSMSTQIFSKYGIPKSNAASFHPIQTFNSITIKNNHLLSGIYYGIEGGETAKKFLIKLAKKLNSKVIDIPASRKPLYHLASVIASNLFVTNLSIISDILSKLGIKDMNAFDVYKGIIITTMKNMEEKGINDALTGPIERNDTETILTHLEYLRKYYPEIECYYKEASKMTSKVALKKGSLNKKQFEELNRHLSKDHEKID